MFAADSKNHRTTPSSGVRHAHSRPNTLLIDSEQLVLGVRAFGIQLLCEQVFGRALRRQSYDLNEDGLFNVEYADALGIPFDFTAKPVVASP